MELFYFLKSKEPSKSQCHIVITLLLLYSTDKYFYWKRGR